MNLIESACTYSISRSSKETPLSENIWSGFTRSLRAPFLQEPQSFGAVSSTIVGAPRSLTSWPTSPSAASRIPPPLHEPAVITLVPTVKRAGWQQNWSRSWKVLWQKMSHVIRMTLSFWQTAKCLSLTWFDFASQVLAMQREQQQLLQQQFGS